MMSLRKTQFLATIKESVSSSPRMRMDKLLSPSVNSVFDDTELSIMEDGITSVSLKGTRSLLMVTDVPVSKLLVSVWKST